MISDTPTSFLGNKLYHRFIEYKKLRRGFEDRWLADLRQYRGIYDPMVEARIGPDKSKTFAKLTRIKVRSITARLIDLTFPAGHDYPWALLPSKIDPDMNDPRFLGIAQELMMQTGMMPAESQIQQIAMEQAAASAKAMEQEIRDQLDELKFRKLLRQIIHSGNLYGTGLIKGPLVDEKVYKHWTRGVDGGWVPQRETKLRPYLEFVRVWDSYPDPDAVSFRDLTGHFQRHVMTRPQLRKLVDREDFDGPAILDAIRANPDGNAPFEYFETQLRWMGFESHTLHPRTKRYEVWEYWGVVDGRDLSESGLEIGDDTASEFWCNVWGIGSDVIKLSVTPIDGIEIPYYAYYFEKDETAIFGDGVAFIMRDDQAALNASIRAMLDNAAITAGSQVEVNLDLLSPEEDPQAVYPGRVWKRVGAGAEAQYPAVRSFDMPSHTQEYLVLAQKFETNIHESTVPSYMHGETDRGVGRTVGGLSMLMGTAQTSLKDQLVILDDDVLEPVIQAMYDWNMQFSDREDIRGDFLVDIHGTSSLVAKEVKSQALEQFASSTANPIDAQYIDRFMLNKERAKALDLPEAIVHEPIPMYSESSPL